MKVVHGSQLRQEHGGNWAHALSGFEAREQADELALPSSDGVAKQKESWAEWKARHNPHRSAHTVTKPAADTKAVTKAAAADTKAVAKPAAAHKGAETKAVLQQAAEKVAAAKAAVGNEGGDGASELVTRFEKKVAAMPPVPNTFLCRMTFWGVRPLCPAAV